jgi:hypothetical protein
MKMETQDKVMVRTYSLTGRTSSGKFVTIGHAKDCKVAIQYFIKRYPRFNGVVRLQTQIAQDCGNGMLCAEMGKWETLQSFESTKELINFLGEKL